MRRVRVAHVITRLCKGGAQENTFYTVRLANRERFDIDLICGTLTGDEGSMEDDVREAGIEPIRAPALMRPVAPLKEYAAYRQLRRIFETGRYDIVHTHTSKAGILGRWAAHRCGVPVIVHTPHGNIFDGYFSGPVTWLFKALEARAARWSDRLIELTAGGVEEYLAEGIGRRDQYAVIFSGIDLAPYEAAMARRDETRRALDAGPDEILIGGVGRLEPVKGFNYFMEAALRAAAANPRLRFVHAGVGSMEQAVREQAAPLGDRMQFLGLRRDVPELMAAMDALVVPSLNEGMGRVILEAGAAGTPAIASRVGGLPDVVRDGETGLLVPPKDAGALAAAMLALAKDAERREAMGRRARAFVVPDFSLENMVMRIEALYEDVLREKGIA